MGLYDELLMGKPAGEDRVYSITTGIVKENWEEKQPGKVKAEYFLGEGGKSVTGWVPVASPYAGNGYGAYLLPEVGAEVVIAFNMGDRNCPIIIGSLWNQKNQLPKETAGKENETKSFQTKGGHKVVFSEEKDKEKLEIQSPGGLRLCLLDSEKTITLSDTEGENKITISGKEGTLSLDAKKSITISVGGKKQLLIEGDKVTIKAGNLIMEGQQGVKLKGQTFNAEGTSMNLKAGGTLKLESSGMTEIKGSMVKIN